jgi:WD40 repeat protein
MRSDEDNQNAMTFHPGGEWLITGDWGSMGFWPMSHEYPWALAHGGRVVNLAFTPDGRWLLTIESEGSDLKGKLRAWPLAGQNGGHSRVLAEADALDFYGADLAIDPSGTLVVTGTREGRVLLVPVAGGPVRELTGRTESAADEFRLAFSPSGRLLAGAPGFNTVEDLNLRVWDLASGDSRVVGEVNGVTSHLTFLDEEHILWVGLRVDSSEPGGGERIFNLADGSVEVVKQSGDEYFRAVSPTGTHMLTTTSVGDVFKTETELWLTDLESGDRTWLRDYGGNTGPFDFHPDGRWFVAGDYHDGTVRVGSVDGEEPHLLFGHEDAVIRVVFSPDGSRIASASFDGTVRLWPMPDLDKPPLHTLPREELIAKLKTLTNLRVVRDPESATGWTLTHDPFPGWETVPTW